VAETDPNDLNNIVEQDHRRIKRLVRPGLGVKSLVTASQTLSGYEAMAMIRKGQFVGAPANDMGTQCDFIATLFGAAA
jgi:transposase, IS6 family